MAEDKFIPGMHLRQPGFTYSACEPFPKNKEKIQKFKETGTKQYVYKSKLQSWAKYLEQNPIKLDRKISSFAWFLTATAKV